MTKAKAFTFCTLCSLVTLLMIPLGDAIHYTFCGCWGWLFLVLALIFGAIGYTKVARDQQLTESARAQRYLEPVEPGYGERAQPTTPGSSYIGLDQNFGPPESA